jgi:MarR family transcriptional regulator, lower aerobic nicotinate degradation pathway regulator
MTVTAPVLRLPATARLPAELIASNAFLLKRLGFAAKEQALEAYEAVGVTPYHHAILVLLDEGVRETQGAIADALGYDRGQLVGMLDELEERSLVERRRDPADRRRHLVHITPEGRQKLDELRELARRLEEGLLAPLDADERQQLHRLLMRVAEHHLPACGAMAPKGTG